MLILAMNVIAIVLTKTAALILKVANKVIHLNMKMRIKRASK